MNYEVNIYRKRMYVLTCTPAPRSPSLGNGSLSIIRTGTPFFRSDRARTRPEGPAPTYKNDIQPKTGASCCKPYNEYRLHESRMQRCRGLVKVLDVDELGDFCE